eukprot:1151569-Pelagomonas_calceolata.AAC.1
MGIWRVIGNTQLHNLAARSILAFNAFNLFPARPARGAPLTPTKRKTPHLQHRHQQPQATSALTEKSMPQSSTSTFLPQHQQQQQQQQQGRRDGKPEAEEDEQHAQTKTCNSESTRRLRQCRSEPYMGDGIRLGPDGLC